MRAAEYYDRAPLALVKCRAAYYGMYLTRVCHYAPDEAAALVVARYPEVQPWLEKAISGQRSAVSRQLNPAREKLKAESCELKAIPEARE